MAAFAKFGSDLDAATQRQLARGERLTELLKQKQFSPLPVEKQVVIIYAGTKGFVDEIPTAALGRYEEGLFPFLAARFPTVTPSIRDAKAITPANEPALKEALEAFGKAFQA
jgi:F-type H+-transporting ATPase subunit alpha